MEEIYLDNAATTRVSDEVYAELMDKYKNVYGNASTLYGLGRQSKEVMEHAREVIAKSINADPEEIVFTSGGSESDNTAVMQTAFARQSLGKHIITTAIEHEAILRPMQALEKLGFRITYLPVDQYGNISLDDFKAALDDDTILVSIMTGNNEVGSVMPIHEIGEILKDHQAWFHTDAVQAYGLLDIDVQRDHIDLLSTSAHKINGPKMIGFLYRRTGVNFPSLIKGGDQETKRRAGTENVPAIAGFARAVETITSEEKAHRQAKYLKFKKYIADKLTKNGIDFDINGQITEDNLNHVFNIWLKGISTYVMQTNLDLAGIAVSGGSACTAGSIEPSHVLVAMYGKDSPRISESIRISFGRYNTYEDLDKLVAAITQTVKRLKNKNREVKL
ncbi:MAG: cysteine desulfurase family protein [Lentilactobacillus hilgardii]|uniref:Aminotransferase, class V n=2 Tax=Lentilactobacillus hilgardii TaxID=1588 RepID=C0XKK7_LENH9|nr:cysteine desulfurase family protein [Lentilactobacillus hilgardii]EEI19915.1 aminotransferase, class V [Lentilactobacillus buchneri ATCC 11577]MCI1923416.1 cysteine desulfurase [Lentilactobacillus buchneri]RRG08270.1 MAG: cysteine desulfurase [Lactobacillus sp.]EEI24110.1 aminotransferase, class V [Lentilactobacillus hilgardii DSM 20176 = ATCC 8290]EEI71172.1 aminotransferase, class V [Lentilactobacillus hilgardii ATCC 27305]